MAGPPVDVQWLEEGESEAWRAWLAMSELVRTQVGRDIQADTGLSDPDFALLVHLSEAQGDRMRMNELATALRWSKSRLSHQFARMEGRGLVRRETCPSDARSAYACLTRAGRREIEHAAPLHVASVRRNFIDLLTPPQLAALAEISGVVVDRLLANGAASDGGIPPCPSRQAG